MYYRLHEEEIFIIDRRCIHLSPTDWTSAAFGFRERTKREIERSISILFSPLIVEEGPFSGNDFSLFPPSDEDDDEEGLGTMGLVRVPRFQISLNSPQNGKMAICLSRDGRGTLRSQVLGGFIRTNHSLLSIYCVYSLP